jgi:uncharacterized integral membrane protein (TIGR00697 family)
MDIQQQIKKQNQERENKSYRCLTSLAMLCMTLMLCKSIFSYRLVSIHGYIFQAGQLIAPLFFTLSDIIAEIYLYNIARQVIIAGFICQILFTVITLLLVHLPHPAFSHNSQAYEIVFGDMWRVTFAVLIAFIISSFINIKLITRWRFLTQGKYFWLRSIGASGVSEFFYSIVATLIIQYGKQNTHTLILIITASFSLKILYSCLLAWPANKVVNIVKKIENIKF